MLRVGRDRLLDEGLVLPAIQCDAEALPFPQRKLRLRHDRIRPAQRDAQGAARWRDGALLRPGGRLLVLEFSHGWPSRCSRCTTLTRSRCFRGWASCRGRRSELPLPGGIDPHAPGQEELKAMMEAAGLEHGRLLEPGGGRGRDPSRLSFLMRHGRRRAGHQPRSARPLQGCSTICWTASLGCASASFRSPDGPRRLSRSFPVSLHLDGWLQMGY